MIFLLYNTREKGYQVACLDSPYQLILPPYIPHPMSAFLNTYYKITKGSVLIW